ncbi:cell wall hydrolase [Brevundimonas diminuta]|uniref:cell wall hydrolase n=1 Tax=Brevundimonas diminuta TaxID=293 RepID=UPI003CFD7B1C
MRGIAPVLMAGGLGIAAWAGLSGHIPFANVLSGQAQAQPGAVRPIPAYVPAAAAAPVMESDVERRARLNVRLQAMVREGKGGRLTDSAPLARPPGRAGTRRPSAAAEAAAPKSEPAASFTPPPLNLSAATSARRGAGGYVAPVLDLKTPPRIPDNDLECLTQAIYYEARNESESGQAAVAEVVLNRSRHHAYPQDVCEVVYQRNSRTCQFTFTCDGSIGRRAVNAVAWARAERIAREVYEGRSASLLPKNSVNYHANYVRPSWGRRLERVRQIGAHIFYGAPLNGGATPGAREREAAPPAPRLLFVRNEALDRAYALVAARAYDPAATDVASGPVGS